MLRDAVHDEAMAPGRTLADTRPKDVPFADCYITPESIAEASRVLASGWVTTGREVAAFEEEFASAVGAAHAVAVSSCTHALELALTTLELAPGAKVLVSSVTFCGAVHAIRHAGLQPVLVDVDPVTALQTPELTARAVADCGGVAAMMVVHLTGAPCDVPALASAAGLPLSHVVEDAAHALGTYVHGRPVGSQSGATCFSFYATKNLPIGEGGMVVTEDADRADALRRTRLHGMSADAWRRYLPGGSWRYDVTHRGLKANMTDVQAAIGRVQLRHFDHWQQRRADLAAHYDDRLADVTGIATPARPSQPDDRHAWHLYAIRVRPVGRVSRDDVIACLAAKGIGTSVHFIPIHRLSYFHDLVERPRSGLGGADSVFPQLLSLPLYPRLSHDQVDDVCDVLIDSIGAEGNRRTYPR